MPIISIMTVGLESGAKWPRSGSPLRAGLPQLTCKGGGPAQLSPIVLMTCRVGTWSVEVVWPQGHRTSRVHPTLPRWCKAREESQEGPLGRGSDPVDSGALSIAATPEPYSQL